MRKNAKCELETNRALKGGGEMEVGGLACQRDGAERLYVGKCYIEQF